jgi:phosphoribosylamine--glycine ligase
VKVLVIGSGGREHALCWKLAQSRKLDRLYCAPGNAGIAQIAECVAVPAEDQEALVEFAGSARIDLTVVGPEAPLVNGIVNRFEKAKLAIFGPSQEAAMLEGSKAFARTFMRANGIPGAHFAVHTDFEKAVAEAKKFSFPMVVKASGLAAGKGVVICRHPDEAEAALREMLVEGRFGEAGSSVVLEEFLEGEEASALVLTDGTAHYLLPFSQDHKRLLDGDRGPNTGGMGAYAPAPLISLPLRIFIQSRIIKPTIRCMRQRGTPYVGCLYVGLMITERGPRVLEYNCRFGDPETQAVLPLYEGDFLDALSAVLQKRIFTLKVFQQNRAAACVVLASAGYPGTYEKGKVITGLEKVPRDVVVFHAGTKKEGDRLVTDGGRVLGVTGIGGNLSAALRAAYAGVETIQFEGKTYRKDIGEKGLRSENRQSASPL